MGRIFPAARYDRWMYCPILRQHFLALWAWSSLLAPAPLWAADTPTPTTSPAPEILDLSAPTPQKPPRPADDNATDDENLERKRRQRHRRARDDQPAPVPYAKKREESLRQDTLLARPRAWMIEVAPVISTAETHGEREGYAVDPNIHIGVFYRHDAAKKDGKTGLWYGARVAPFIGTGFQKNRPGAFGLTYFGPMIGLGKIDPVAQDDGSPKATSATGELEIPSASGWLVSGGFAAVTKLSRSEDTELDDPSSDFVSKGVAFDGPGAWLETRYLKILYGGFGWSFVVGVQAGREKYFYYGGGGASFWY